MVVGIDVSLGSRKNPIAFLGWIRQVDESILAMLFLHFIKYYKIVLQYRMNRVNRVNMQLICSTNACLLVYAFMFSIIQYIARFSVIIYIRRYTTHTHTHTYIYIYIYI